MPTLTVASAVADRSLVTVAAVKTELGITDTASDALLTQWIKDDSDAVAEVCCVHPDQKKRRTFLEEAVTITFAADEVPAGCGEPAALILPWRLPLEIDAVTVGGEPLATSGYLLDDAMMLWRLDSCGRRTHWGRRETVITGTAGWVLADVPAALKGAVTELVKLRWHAKERGDPMLRSYENPDVEKVTFMDSDKRPMRDGLPAEIVDRLAPYRNVVLA